MNSRERVVAALKHRVPDRIPLDIGGTESSGLTAIASRKLRERMNLPASRNRVFDPYQQIVTIDDDLRDALEIDTVPLLLEPRKWKTFTLPDGISCEIPEKWNPVKEGDDWVVRDDAGRVVARMPGDGFYFESTCAPYANARSAADFDRDLKPIETFDWPGFADQSFDELAERARELNESSDRAIVANFGVHLLAAGQMLRGYEDFMMDLVADKPLARALLDRLTDAYLARAERYLDAVGEHVQVVLVNDDLGTQQGPMMSIDLYREMIWPCQKRLFGFIKSRTDAALLMHSCGSVARFIPLLIEAGVDALNPVQVSAAEMDTKTLKREYGKDLTFWGGGCDTQRILNRGSASGIEAEVRRRIHDLAPGGGFVFTQVHNIQPDVPAENVLVMLEAFRCCRDY